MRITIAAVGVWLLLSSQAWAYLDPGTGSILLQGITGAIATVLVSITLAWQHIKNKIAAFRQQFKKADAPPADTQKPPE